MINEDCINYSIITGFCEQHKRFIIPDLRGCEKCSQYKKPFKSRIKDKIARIKKIKKKK